MIEKVPKYLATSIVRYLVVWVRSNNAPSAYAVWRAGNKIGPCLGERAGFEERETPRYTSIPAVPAVLMGVGRSGCVRTKYKIVSTHFVL